MTKIEWFRGMLRTGLLSLIRSPSTLALSLLPVFLSVGASYYIDSMVFAFLKQNVSRVAMATCGLFAIAKIVAICFDHGSRSSFLSRGDDLKAILCEWSRSPDGKFIHGSSSSSSRGISNSMLRDVGLCRHCRRRPIIVPMDEEAAILLNNPAAAPSAARYVVTSSNLQQQHQAICIPQFSTASSAAQSTASSSSSLPDSAAAAINAHQDSSSSSSVDDEEETVCKTTVFETHSSDNNNNENRSSCDHTIFSTLRHEFYDPHDADHRSAHMFLDVVGSRSGAAAGSKALESYEMDEVAVDVKHQILPLIRTETDGRRGSSEQDMYRCASAAEEQEEEEEKCSNSSGRRNGGHEEEDAASILAINRSSSATSSRCCSTTSTTAEGASSWSVLDHHHHQQQQQLITDAELQKAAAEYYTLEGDVLWTRPPDPPPGQQQIMPILRIDPEHRMVDLYSRPSSTFSTPCLISRLKSNKSPTMQQQLNISSGNPAESINSCNIIIIDDAYDGAETQRQAKAAGANHLRLRPPHHVNVMAQPISSEDTTPLIIHGGANVVDDDLLIDLKLRDIAFTSRNKVGDESNYMSTAGSFRDMGSFRELFDHETWRSDHQQWDAAAGFENMVGSSSTRIGCCDDQEKPCITHCRSRSKVLQTDPLISIASLSKEQEIMDVLWQEQDEHHMYDADCCLKRRYNCNSSSCSSNDGSLGMGSNRSSSDAKPAADPDHHKMKECNHPQNRRRSFIGICRVLRELGLKQCLQSSRVDS